MDLLSWDVSKWAKIKSEEEFRFLAARIVANQWRSNTSPFYKKYRKEPMLDSQLVAEVEDVEYEESPRELFIIRLVEELHPSDKTIAKKYWAPGKGNTITEIAQHYDVDKNFIAKAITRIKASLRRRILWTEGKWDDMEVIEELIPLIGRKRIAIDKRQYIIDVYNHLYKAKANNVHSNEECKRALDKIIKSLKL